LALGAFEQGGIFIVPHLLWHGTSVFLVSSEGLPPFSRLLRHAWGCRGPILTRILTGCITRYHIMYTMQRYIMLYVNLITYLKQLRFEAYYWTWFITKMIPWMSSLFLY
jgi:hypothetical protein